MRVPLGGFVGFVLASIACFDPGPAVSPPPGGKLPGRLVTERGTLIPTHLLTGELEAEEALALTAPNVDIWPLTVRYLAEDGAEVAAGEVVVEFDNSQLVSNLEDLRIQATEADNRLASERSRVAAEVASAAFEVERKRAELDKARIDASVPAELVAEREHAEAQLALKRAELALVGAEQALATARRTGEADIRLQEIALDRARDAARRTRASIDELSLRAPRAGILVRGSNPMEGRSVRVGDTVWPGLTVASLPDLATLLVRARLFDVDDGRIAAGQTVVASLDAFPELVLRGAVRSLEAVAHELGPESPRRFFDVTVDLDQIDPRRMRPGMSVKLLVESEPLVDVLLVPRQAVLFSEAAPRVAMAGGDLASVVLGSCTARACVVVEGLEAGSELRHAGLTPGGRAERGG